MLHQCNEIRAQACNLGSRDFILGMLRALKISADSKKLFECWRGSSLDDLSHANTTDIANYAVTYLDLSYNGNLSILCSASDLSYIRKAWEELFPLILFDEIRRDEPENESYFMFALSVLFWCENLKVLNLSYCWYSTESLKRVCNAILHACKLRACAGFSPLEKLVIAGLDGNYIHVDKEFVASFKQELLLKKASINEILFYY
jgi:hypothetical protein